MDLVDVDGIPAAFRREVFDPGEIQGIGADEGIAAGLHGEGTGVRHGLCQGIGIAAADQGIDIIKDCAYTGSRARESINHTQAGQGDGRSRSPGKTQGVDAGGSAVDRSRDRSRGEIEGIRGIAAGEVSEGREIEHLPGAIGIVKVAGVGAGDGPEVCGIGAEQGVVAAVAVEADDTAG